jgi:hypothetical protein
VESPAPPPPPALPEPPPRARPPRFDPPNVLWYFGAISATVTANAVLADTGDTHRGLWIFVVALAFLGGAAGLCAWALRLGWWVPGGVLATSAVALVPAVAVGFEHLIGVWPKDPEATTAFRGFEGYVFAPAAVTVAAGLIAFSLVPFGFVLLPVAVAAAFGIQFLLPVFVDHPSVGDNMTTLLVTGAAFVVIGMLLDARGFRSAAFWWHVVGLFAIGNGLVYYVGVNPLLPGDHSAVWAWVTMLVVGTTLVVAAFPVGRATWAAYGVAGVYAPLLHYVNEASGAWRVPLLMVFIGVGLMFVGAILDVVGPTWPQRLARPTMRPRT